MSPFFDELLESISPQGNDKLQQQNYLNRGGKKKSLFQKTADKFNQLLECHKQYKGQRE